MRSVPCVLAAVLLPLCGTAQPVTVAPYVGLYAAEGMPRLIVYSPAAGQLALGFGDGEVRGLAANGDSWQYGPSLGVTTPAEGRVSFVRDGQGVASAVMWTHGERPAVRANRVALREDSVHVAGSVRLAASVILPIASPKSTVILLHGSDAESREANRALAYTFAASGVAAVIFDQRGTGQSEGSTSGLSFRAFAEDVGALIGFTRAHSVLGRLPLGIFGPSQGSWVALETTRLRQDIDFLILQSGDATTPLEQEIFRGTETLRRVLHLPEDALTQLSAYRRQKFEVAISGTGQEALDQRSAAVKELPWFRYVGANLPNRAFWSVNGRYDPSDALRQFRGAVLAIFGERDSYKDVGFNASRMRELLGTAGNPASRVVVMPGANHGIFLTDTGLPLDREFPKLSRLAPGYLELITQFASARTR